MLATPQKFSLFHKTTLRDQVTVSNNKVLKYRQQGKVMFYTCLSVHRGKAGRPPGQRPPPPTQTEPSPKWRPHWTGSPGQGPPWTETTHWTETPGQGSLWIETPLWAETLPGTGT